MCEVDMSCEEVGTLLVRVRQELGVMCGLDFTMLPAGYNP